jgi:hypothetical protein
MIRTRGAALAQSGNRFSSGQTPCVCLEIMLNQKKRITIRFNRIVI